MMKRASGRGRKKLEVSRGAWKQSKSARASSGDTCLTVGTPLLTSESADQISRVLADLMPGKHQRDEIRDVVVDYCQEALWTEIRTIFPNTVCNDIH